MVVYFLYQVNLFQCRVGDYKLIIGETRGDYWVPPPEIANADKRRRRKQVSRRHLYKRSGRFLTLPFLNDTEYNSFQSVEAEDTRIFELPSFAAYDYDVNKDEGVDYTNIESDDVTSESLDCEGVTQKQCRENKRQLRTFGSFSTVEDFFDHQAEIRLYDLTSKNCENVSN